MAGDDKNLRFLLIGLMAGGFFFVVAAALVVGTALYFSGKPTAPTEPTEIVISAPIPQYEASKTIVKGDVFVKFPVGKDEASGCEVILGTHEIEKFLEQDLFLSRQAADELVSLKRRLQDLEKAGALDKEARQHAAIYNRVQGEKEDFHKRGYNYYPFVHPYRNTRSELNWHKGRKEADRLFDSTLAEAERKVKQTTDQVRSLCQEHGLEPQALMKELAAAKRSLTEAPRPRTVSDIMKGLSQSRHAVKVMNTNKDGEFEFQVEPGAYTLLAHYHEPLTEITFVWLSPVAPTLGVYTINMSQENARHLFKKDLPTLIGR